MSRKLQRVTKTVFSAMQNGSENVRSSRNTTNTCDQEPHVPRRHHGPTVDPPVKHQTNLESNLQNSHCKHTHSIQPLSPRNRNRESTVSFRHRFRFRSHPMHKRQRCVVSCSRKVHESVSPSRRLRPTRTIVDPSHVARLLFG